MAMEKSLYQAPAGIPEDDPFVIDIEIEGEVVETGEEEEEFDENLAEVLDESYLATLAGDLISDYEEDIASRKDWITTYVDGLELLGLKIEERMEPWEGACGIVHPLLTESLVRFQAETIMSIFPAEGPVKAKIRGKETQEKKEAAMRVRDDMNFKLTEDMPEFRPEMERAIWGLGLAGNAFKKVYEDPNLGRQVSYFVPAEDVVVPYGTADLNSAERVTHVMRKYQNDMRKLQVSGFYRDIDLGDPVNALDEVEKKIAERMGFKATNDDRYKLLEMQVNLDLPGYEDEVDGEATGIELPYIVTIEKNTTKVLSIRRNWKEGDKKKLKRQHFVHYGYIPGFGFYCFGLIHLIGAYAKAGTSITRQLVDAGTLANLPGGFKSRGMRIKGDDTPIAPGEWRDVDIASGTIKDNIIPLPYKEPSQTLAALLSSIIEEGRRFANTADINVADMSANAPVGTTMALLERTLKVLTAVQARVHFSLKQELKLLKLIIAENAPDTYDYDPESGNRAAKKSDYADIDVIPVSDPNASTLAQKIIQYQAALQLAQGAPQFYNMPLLHRQMLEVLGLKEANKLVPLPEDMKPVDPVTETQNILMAKPVKAFAYQDHKAHITVHVSAMHDPKIAQMIGQTPQAQQLQAAMQAHVNEHLGFAYRVEIEKQLGMNLPAMTDEMGEDAHIDPELEAKLAPLLATAAQQLLQQNQGEAQQQQAQQQAQDPIIQMQQMEMKIKEMEVERKKLKDQVDAQAKNAELALRKQEIDNKARVDGINIGVKSKEDDRKFQADNTARGIQLGLESKKHGNEMDHKKMEMHQRTADTISKEP